MSWMNQSVSEGKVDIQRFLKDLKNYAGLGGASLKPASAIRPSANSGQRQTDLKTFQVEIEEIFMHNSNHIQLLMQ